MSGFVFTPEAETDLFEIWSHIAQDSLESADSVESELYKACRFLVSKPYAGHSRHDLTTRPASRVLLRPKFGCSQDRVVAAIRQIAGLPSTSSRSKAST